MDRWHVGLICILTFFVIADLAPVRGRWSDVLKFVAIACGLVAVLIPTVTFIDWVVDTF